MPRYIVKLETTSGPRYLEYSTIVDAPVTYGSHAARRAADLRVPDLLLHRNRGEST